MSTITPIGGLGSQNIQGDSTFQYDYSQAFGGSDNQSQGMVGSNFQLGNASGATFNVSDPVSTLAGRDVAMAGLTAASSAQSDAIRVANDAIAKALELAGVSQQGQGGTLIRGLIMLALVGAAGWALIAWINRREKEKGAEK